jgi:hypothetical protein
MSACIPIYHVIKSQERKKKLLKCRREDDAALINNVAVQVWKNLHAWDDVVGLLRWHSCMFREID